MPSRVSLRKYLETLAAQRWAAHWHVHDAEERARSRATDSLDRRLDGMNEFREELREQAARFATNEFVDGKAEALRVRIDSIEKRNANLDGRLAMVAVLVSAVVSIAVGLLITILH